MIEQTTRLGLSRWTSDDDPVSRLQLNADHVALDVKVMRDTHGPDLAARPAPGSVPRGTWWTDDAAAVTYRSDGVAWTQVTTPEQPVSAVLPEPMDYGAAGVAGTSLDAVRGDHTHAHPTHDAADHAGVPLSAFAAATAALSMGGHKITGLGTPSANTDLATKAYVDSKFV